MKKPQRLTDAREVMLQRQIERLKTSIHGQEKALETQRKQMGQLAHRTDVAERQTEAAESAARSLTAELSKARRRIAELESLVGAGA